MSTRKTTRTPPRSPRRKRPTRAYTKGFKPHGAGRDFKLNRIPAGFWTRVQGKARREGVSLRGLLLTYLAEWVGEAA